jgi:uncharacterized protein YegJ (DUF2314 family)
MRAIVAWMNLRKRSHPRGHILSTLSPSRQESNVPRPSRLPALLLCLFGLASCSSTGESTGEPRTPFPPGPAFEERMAFEFAVFYTSPPLEEPVAAFEALLARDFTGYTRLAELGKEEIGNRRIAGAMWVTDARTSYVPPDLEGLRYAGHGLDEAQAEALQQSEQALRLLFAYGSEHRWSGMREALRLTSALARRTGGLIWDNVSREIFTPDFWDEHRIAPWPETDGPPDLGPHFTIHSYREDSGFHRAVSLGLRKFGLPDIVIENSSGSVQKGAGNTINLLAQALAEGTPVGSDGEFELDLRSMSPSTIRDGNLASLGENATAKANLRLVQGTRDEGDSENRLIEIAFDRYPGPDLQARQERLFIELFGTEEDVTADVDHEAEVLAASERARQKLAALQPAFEAGLPPGEILLVKAPFPAPDGRREWMWVEVIEWQGDRISGTLQNDPVHVELKAGQRVQVSAAEVFDYLHKKADDSREGNETEKLLYPEG